MRKALKIYIFSVNPSKKRKKKMQVRRETASHQFAQKKPANIVFRHLCMSRVFRFLSKGDNHQENALCHVITLQSPAPRSATVPKVI